MSLETLKSKIPDYAKDIKLNLSSLLGGTEPLQLNPIQIAGLALSAAYATRQKTVIQLLETFAKQQGLTDGGVRAVKAAASVMAMNNVYYRSMHFIPGETYVKLPANLRMHILKKHGISQEDFELYCTIVSAINGCAHCVAAHIKGLETAGVSTREIHYSLRLASVIQGLAQVMTIEESSI